MATDHLATYRSITAKLKKRRFMRKPNVAECSEQFRALSSSMKQEGMLSYPAFVLLAAARCEQALNNPTGEAERLVQSAQLFMQAEVEDRAVRFAGFEENVTEAIHCYELAIDTYIRLKRQAFAATLYVELGNALKILKHEEAATAYLFKAVNLLGDSPLAIVSALEKIIEIQASMEKYEAGLDTVKKVFDTVRSAISFGKGIPPSGTGYSSHLWEDCPAGAYRDIIARNEVTSCLLLLLLPPHIRTSRDAYKMLLDRFQTLSTSTMSIAHMNPDVFFHMQAACIAVEDQDIDALQELQAHLHSHLSPGQFELLCAIPETFSNRML